MDDPFINELLKALLRTEYHDDFESALQSAFQSPKPASRQVEVTKRRGFSTFDLIADCMNSARCRTAIIAYKSGIQAKGKAVCNQAKGSNRVFKTVVLHGNVCTDCIYNGTGKNCSFALYDRGSGTRPKTKQTSILFNATKRSFSEVEKGVESQPHAKRNRVLAAKCTHGINASNQYIPCHSKSSSIDGNTVENLHSFIVEVKVYILRMEDGLQKLREIITNNTTRHITENFHQNSFTASIDFTVIQAEIVRDILSRSQATNMKESRVSLLSARASCLKALKDSESKTWTHFGVKLTKPFAKVKEGWEVVDSRLEVLIDLLNSE